jgi:hypothetical protein
MARFRDEYAASMIGKIDGDMRTRQRRMAS